MKDITAILLLYSDAAAIHKALVSLKRIGSRLDSVIVLHKEGMPLTRIQEDIHFEQLQTSMWKEHHFGKALNDIIQQINSSYVLFLYDTDYLSPAIQANSLHLSQSDSFSTNIYHNRKIAVHRPFLARASFLKSHPFLLSSQLPFHEALFPAWIFDKSSSMKTCQEDMVLQSRGNNSVNILEKQKFMQKYQLKKIQTTNPSLTVLISNYNMEQYVETAVVSCLLQNEQPEQILIIDDGSTDNSSHKLKLWNDGKQVRLFEKKNEGKAIALNHLLPHVTTDFILELDADDWLDPNAISVIKKLLADVSENVSVLYGNLRKWKQLEEDILFKGVTKGNIINGRADLLSYRFPLGPRIYRTSALKRIEGFPVIAFKDGKLYEDVSVLNQLIKDNRFQYHDFTVYNVREHKDSITKTNRPEWSKFLKSLK